MNQEEKRDHDKYDHTLTRFSSFMLKFSKAKMWAAGQRMLHLQTYK